MRESKAAPTRVLRVPHASASGPAIARTDRRENKRAECVAGGDARKLFLRNFLLHGCLPKDPECLGTGTGDKGCYRDQCDGHAYRNEPPAMTKRTEP